MAPARGCGAATCKCCSTCRGSGLRFTKPPTTGREICCQNAVSFGHAPKAYLEWQPRGSHNQRVTDSWRKQHTFHAAGRLALIFTLWAGLAAVCAENTQTATITATLNGVSKTVTVTLDGAATLESFTCSATSRLSGTGSNCTVTLTGPAAGSSVALTLTSNNSLLHVPGSVTVPAGSASVSFTATAGVINVSRTAVVTAKLGKASLHVGFQLLP